MLKEIIIILICGGVISAFIWTILETGKSINNLEEDGDGFYDKRDRV